MSESIPVLCVVFNVVITSDEGFTSINSDDFNDFGPLVNDIALLISLDDSGLDMVEVVDSVVHVQILVDLNVLRIEHFFVVRHFYLQKLYYFLF